MEHSKKIGFLSFGAWHPAGGLTYTGGDALHQTVELAVAAEEIGIDGAFVRVHHFAQQLSSPFPLLAAIGVRCSPFLISCIRTRKRLGCRCLDSCSDDRF